MLYVHVYPRSLYHGIRVHVCMYKYLPVLCTYFFVDAASLHFVANVLLLAGHHSSIPAFPGASWKDAHGRCESTIAASLRERGYRVCWSRGKTGRASCRIPSGMVAMMLASVQISKATT